MLALVLVVSCAPAPTAPEAPVEVPTETTGEASVDEVATDISDAVDIGDALDASELDDVDSILADIENI